MDDKLRAPIERFLSAFEMVFEEDWSYTKEMLGITDESEGQTKDLHKLGLETMHVISPGGSFLTSEADDEAGDWGNRAELLSAYRELKKLLRQ